MIKRILLPVMAFLIAFPCFPQAEFNVEAGIDLSGRTMEKGI